MSFPNENLSPINYLKIIFRRKHVFIISLISGLVIGICFGMFIHQKYKSSTILLVEEGKTDNPLFDKIAISSTVQQRLGSIRESILGWNSLVELVNRLHLDSKVKNKDDFENLILTLKRDMIIKLSDPNLLELSYEGRNPNQAKAIVENITDIFISKNVNKQNQETSDAIKFIEQQLQVYKGKIRSAEIAKLQDQLNLLLVDSTDNHPTVKQLKEQIQKEKDALEKENLQYTESDPLSKTTTNPIITEIQKALSTIESDKGEIVSTGNKTELYKVMLLDKLDNVMARDVKVNEDIYNMLLQRLETAKITQRLQSSKEGTKYTILDPARAPLKPTNPYRMLMAAIGGLFLGGCAGIGLIFLFEILDKSFLDVEDAKNFLGMPLIGAISLIQTEETLQHKRDKIGHMYFIIIIISNIVISFSVLVRMIIR